MNIRTLKRHMREGTKNLVRNGWMTFASVSAVTVMLVIVGFFLVMFLNGNHIAHTVENSVEIRAFYQTGTDDEKVKEVIAEVEALDDVESVRFIDKEEGLERFIASSGENGEVYKSFKGENPLPHALEVTATSPQLTEKVALEIRQNAHIKEVTYGKAYIDSLFKVTNFARIAGLAVVIGLLFTAIFLIANTIKLTILARSKEIQIMKLVGATNGFVRGPFFVEGALLGVIGSVIPITLMGFGYTYAYARLSPPSDALYSLLSPGQLIVQISLLLLVVGLLVGIWGSTMSVRKFLKI
ncbi:permease-like cell division protein FtsX [Shouchella lonarensis]|uniref:Cell division protein FtsX n=1 Tax=Shouchella lonarensis TaxID=1464122 RepID=A0A1G6H1J0_9BACI|nr:permease-like cell division protein FtsX [Shouchella lonarensis]SDB88142.1 cell division protein FtsX [Shouchella lonarensis]